MSERIVMLMDMNAFFAAIEQQCNPQLRGQPIVVCGNPTTRTIVTTASYEARVYGVKSGMSLGEALRRCPKAILIEGNPSKYVDTARHLQEMLLEYSPTVEIFSIDEAFVELPRDEDPRVVARDFKAKLRAEFGLTCSIGLGPNKLVAKLAAGMEKPDGLVWIKQAEIARVFEELPMAELCGIGPQIEKRLHLIGLYTLGQLGRTPVGLLKKCFGDFWGERLWEMGQGIDDAPVVSCMVEPEVKSMGHSYTLNRDTYDMGEVEAHLLRLSLMVGRRLRAERYAGRTIRLTVRTGDFTTLSRHHTFSEWFYHGRQIYQGARQVLGQLKLEGPVRLIGVSVAGLMKDVRQPELFNNSEKLQALEKAEDEILNRFGEFSIKPARLLQVNSKKREAGKWSFTSEPAASRSLAGARRFILTR